MSSFRKYLYVILAASMLAACANAGNNGQELRAPASSAVVNAPDNAAPLPENMGIGANGAGGQAAPPVSASQRAPQIAPVWDGLKARLARDGLSGPAVDSLLADLGARPTQSPMGRKITELYNKQFFPKPKSAQTQKYYKGVVSEANAQLCRQFIKENQSAFNNAWLRYGVPANIASALLFVETRLGKVLGDVPENAFYTLASMSISTQPEDISQYLPKLRDYRKHLPWLEETMRKRANWAYNETKALIAHMLRDSIPPERLPGSIYGAVGLCQFMPSNISVYGADGDGDGRVDLFTSSDAIASLANYLARHGWKPGLDYERQHKALMSYNHSRVYANTILALAQLVGKTGSGV